jgi:hypothetical protein
MGLLQELNEALLESNNDPRMLVKAAVDRALESLSEDELFYTAHSQYRGEGGQNNMINFIASEYGRDFADAYSTVLQALHRLENILQ